MFIHRLFIAGTALLTPFTASAQFIPQILIPGIPGCNFTTGKITAQCIPQFIGHVIELIFALVSSFFLINVIYAGYQIATGAYTGDRSAGKDRLIWSIIGLIVCASAFLILDVALSVIIGP